MSTDYDIELYNSLKQDWIIAKFKITRLEESQRDTRKLLKTMKRVDPNFPVVRFMVVRNRSRLSKMNKDINDLYRFCDKHDI